MMQAEVAHAKGLTFLARANSNHWVVVDGSTKVGADDAASRPKELVLFALGGCTAFDVVTVLEKRRTHYGAFMVRLEADEAKEHPMVFRRVRLTYRFEDCEAPARELERAVRLSHDKYCSVSAMLRRAFPIEWVVERNGERVLNGTLVAPTTPTET